MPESLTPFVRFALAGILLLGAGLRFADAILRPMDEDESFTFIYYASRPLSHGLSDYSLPNNHLLNTLLVHISTSLLGDSPLGIRLPVCLAGILLIPTTFAIGRRLYGPGAGLIAAALSACSQWLIFYSSNARGYMLGALLVMLGLWLALRMRRNNRVGSWIGIAIVSSLALYALPAMLYGVVSLFAGLAWQGLSPPEGISRRAHFLGLAGCGIATAALTAIFYLPVFLTWGVGAVTSNPYTSSLPWSELRPKLTSDLAATGGYLAWSIPWPVLGTLAVGFLVGNVLPGRSWSLAFFLIPAAMILVQRVSPFPRVWTYLVPMFLVTAAGGISTACSFALTALFRDRRPSSADSKPQAAAAVALCVPMLIAVSDQLAIDRDPPFRPDQLADYFAKTLETDDILGGNGELVYPTLYYLGRGGTFCQFSGRFQNLVFFRKNSPAAEAPNKKPAEFAQVSILITPPHRPGFDAFVHFFAEKGVHFRPQEKARIGSAEVHSFVGNLFRKK